MNDTLTVGELKEMLEEYDDDVDVWVARGGATTKAVDVSHSIGGHWGEHITLRG